MPKPLLPATLFMILVTGLMPGKAQADSFTREYMVKAGFIVNLIRFTTWPESRRPEPGEPFLVGICGNPPVTRVLTRALSGGKMVKGHMIVPRTAELQDLLDCYLIFIAGPVSRAQQKLFPFLRDRSILTVGEDDIFLSIGGIVNFSVVGHRLVLDINKAAADSSDLILNAKLLQVARTVVTSYRAPSPPIPQTQQ